MKKVSVVLSLLFASMAEGFTSVPTSFVSRSSPVTAIPFRAASMSSEADEKNKESSSETTTPADATVMASTGDIDSDSAESTSTETTTAPAEVLATQLDSFEVQEVRAELIQKYISLGRTQEYAEREVDEFLSDPERSEQFLEMRRYANAQAEELMGFEIWVQLFGAFALGLGGQFAIKYYNAYRSVYPHGEGPLPWLP
uniref:Uncharacterized protein n=1 Tax=Helicotheca tamesis TaxID=374047 RepID=A0A7S2HA71_9STRA|mmetsp:Transcript_16387/g.22480  ORF Transcript_16387/g.22480 Transcript_16387/m.22480 type:complete len:199 (+) Transcript_16387:56-652(+)|eukprot:CAMPEP_0185741076 /NCGR_PEP_ID=MMETSP1171-20130828/38764_1 /TAXON_ID=374046 /ORGANISM="Helicotheca tamensis, Strain CCMP826" /LENGTH=198 /DNA_ID=CAMNT_0028413019 /DNA_START=44 /DNA_END=640 /DNA_ORIENTATION=+